MKRFLNKVAAIFGVTALVAGGAVLAAATASAAPGDGPDGEVSGHNWPGDVGTNFEGTYRMPDDVTEAWCATIWAPAPKQNPGTVYGPETDLTKTNGTALTVTEHAQLAYIIAEASNHVIGQDRSDPTVRAYAAATAIIVHSWTNSGGLAVYNPAWPLDYFDANDDAVDGSDTSGVRTAYNTLLANAVTHAGEWELTLNDPGWVDAMIGDTLPVTGRLQLDGGSGIPNADIYVHGSGATVPELVTTDASGNFTFDATLTAEDGVISVDRIAPEPRVSMRVATAWQGQNRPQNMVLVSENSIGDEFDFTALPVPVPEISTSASDQSDGDKTLPYDGGTIVDVVSYSDLTPGVEYTLSGVLYNKTDDVLTDIHGQTTFTPAEPSGTVDVTFEVPAGFAGKTLVVFETLWVGDDEIVSHENPDDEAQTIWVNPAPTLATSATDQSDGDRTLPYDGGTIVDVVSYTGLTPGVEYTVTGVIYNKTDSVLTPLTASTEFTPVEPDGTVNVHFTVPAGYAGKTLVVFETLWIGDAEIVSHENPNDEAQTVTVGRQPWIGTNATDQADDDKVLPYDGGTIRDLVSFAGLTPGVEYTLEGVIYNKTDSVLTDITASTTFTPAAASGSVDVIFEVPAGFAGKTLVIFEYLRAGEKPIASHEDPNDEGQTVTVNPAPTLKTSASDQADGDKFLPFNGGTIRDVVTYTGLTPGVEYSVSGVIFNKSDGEHLEISASKLFTPAAADGTVEVEFTIPAGFAGKTLVVFEYLTLEGALVAKHEDPNDAEQTVSVNPAPTIKTSATDQKDGDRVLDADGGTIVDVVTYTGLTPGQQYTLRGELFDKATGVGTGIKAVGTFTPTTPNGSVSLNFTVPKGYAGKTLVVFEKLYDASATLVAEHTDINDAAQTVKVNTPGLPPTGADTSKIVLLAGGAVLAVVIGVLLVARARRKEDIS